jgi:L-seryl-tRNA(Ser) seleniumtransferase
MTLRLYRDGREREIPAVAMLAQSDQDLKRRAERLRQALSVHGVEADLIATSGQVGGGALPLAEPPSWALALAPADRVQDLASRLRRGETVVAARIAEDRVLLDMRAVRDREVDELAACVADAWESEARVGGEAGHA